MSAAKAIGMDTHVRDDGALLEDGFDARQLGKQVGLPAHAAALSWMGWYEAMKSRTRATVALRGSRSSRNCFTK